MNEKPASTIRIDLTEEQKQVVKAAIDRDAEALELTVQELEQRNHNETFVVEDQL